MASEAIFITTTYIKNNTAALGSINDDELRTFIKPAQDIYISRVLGTKLYNRLKDGVENNNLNANEISLLREYIQPALQYWTIYEWILWSNYKLTNKALSKQNSDNSNPSDLNEVNYLKTSIRDWAEYYSERISDFLKDNTSVFPQYLEGVSGYSEKYPKSDNYYWGMFIPNQIGNMCPEKTRWDDINLWW